MNILVLCTGNSARSILGEVILNRLGAGRVTAFSAGSQPKGAVHSGALRLLAARGIDAEGLHSKSWNTFTGPDAQQTLLNRFQVRGAFANFMQQLAADFKSIAASGDWSETCSRCLVAQAMPSVRDRSSSRTHASANER